MSRWIMRKLDEIDNISFAITILNEKRQYQKEQIDKIIGCLSDGTYFIPGKVGLPEIRNWEYDEQSDHVWFELSKIGFSDTDEAPTEDISVENLVTAFEMATWDEEAAYERLINSQDYVDED